MIWIRWMTRNSDFRPEIHTLITKMSKMHFVSGLSWSPELEWRRRKTQKNRKRKIVRILCDVVCRFCRFGPDCTRCTMHIRISEPNKDNEQNRLHWGVAVVICRYCCLLVLMPFIFFITSKGNNSKKDKTQERKWILAHSSWHRTAKYQRRTKRDSIFTDLILKHDHRNYLPILFPPISMQFGTSTGDDDDDPVITDHTWCSLRVPCFLGVYRLQMLKQNIINFDCGARNVVHLRTNDFRSSILFVARFYALCFAINFESFFAGCV